jgi:hypothetical protein
LSRLGFLHIYIKEALHGLWGLGRSKKINIINNNLQRFRFCCLNVVSAFGDSER